MLKQMRKNNATRCQNAAHEKNLLSKTEKKINDKILTPV